MNSNSSSDPNNEILAQFVQDHERRGSAALHEYCLRYPHLSGDIKDVARMRAAMERSAEQAELPMPPQLDGFRIVQKIDHGGMGEIYEAIQERLNRRVAIKVIRRGRASPALRERFLREQEVLARLHHTNIVPIYTAGEAEGLQYFVMPYIVGGTLRRAVEAARNLGRSHRNEKSSAVAALACGEAVARIPTKPPPDRAPQGSESTAAFFPKRKGEQDPAKDAAGADPVSLSSIYFRSVASVMAAAADALQHAHAAGVLHRDLKPSNVMVNPAGQCHLIDFGLARFLAQSERPATEQSDDATTDLPLASGILGTPNYMAPEQIQQQDSPRSDVWGLGVTLYELLTLRRAFEASSSPELFRKIQADDPTPPLRFIKNVPADLAAICAKAMRKTPDQRYASAGEMAADLKRWLNFEPTTARPARTLRRTLLWSRRNKGWSAAIAMVFLLLVGGVAMSQSERAREIRRTKQVADAQLMAIHDYVHFRVATPTQGRRRESLAALHATAEPRRLIGPDAQREKLDLSSRSLLVEALACPEIVVGESAKLPQVGLLIWPVAMHPSGRQMAIGTTARPLSWRKGAPLILPKNVGSPIPGSQLAYSPDGKWLLVAPDGGGLETWDADATHTEGEWKPEGVARVLGMACPPERGEVVVCTAAGLVQTLALPHLEPSVAWKIKEPETPWTAAAFDRSATRVAAGNAQGFVIVSNAEGAEIAAFKAGRSEIEAIAWSHDGKLLAIGSQAGRVSLWDVEGGFSSYSFQLMGADYTWLEFTLDGWLLASRRQSRMTVWNVATGQQILTGDRVERGSLSSDGRQLAASRADSVSFCELQRGELIREFNGHRSMVSQIVWCANNESFASIDNAFQVHVWRIGSSDPLRSFAVPHEHYLTPHRGVAALAVSSDGRLLAYASGGAEESHLLLYDVAAGKELWRGKRSGAFEHLAAVGDDRFLLVRDELMPGTRTRLTRQYEWKRDSPPQDGKVLREGKPGEAGTNAATLTPDGRYFCWVGPGAPVGLQRIEIWETESGGVRRFPEPETGALLSDDGRYLWLEHSTRRQLFDFSVGGPSKDVAKMPVAVSSQGNWTLFTPRSVESGRKIDLRLHRGDEVEPWLDVYGHLDDLSCVPVFSRDGNRLAWGVDRGTVKVADLPALRKRVDAFQKAVLPK